MILKLKSLEFERFVLLVERNEIFHLMDDLSQIWLISLLLLKEKMEIIWWIIQYFYNYYPIILLSFHHINNNNDVKSLIL